MPTRFQISAGGIVYRCNEQGKLEVALIATHGGERWQLPKGLVEKGEPLEQTALREVREETGLEAEIVEKLEPIEYWFWGTEEGQRVRYHKKVYFFIMRFVGGDTSQHDFEVDQACWFPIEEAIERASYRTERELLAKVQEWGQEQCH